MDFLSLAKKRYACRKYTAQKVEQAKLDTILEAGRVAPTGANRQPQRLIVVRSEEGMAPWHAARAISGRPAPSSYAPIPARPGSGNTTAR